MTDSPREERPETELHEFVAYVMDSTMRRLEVVVVHASDARSLERRLQEARRENVEHAITQVKATRIIRELDAKLDAALRELAEERKRVIWPEEPSGAVIAEGWALCNMTPAEVGRVYKAMRAAALAEKGKP